MFIFKKKKIVIDAFTWNSSINSYFKPDLSNKFLPDWWKQLPSTFNGNNKYDITTEIATIKRCDGIINLYKKGFIIPLWSDLIVETNENGEWRSSWSSDNSTNIIDHDKRQLGNISDDLIHIKIISPWILKEKTGVEFYWAEPVWNNLQKFNNVTFLPGVLDFKYQNNTNINILFPKKNARYEFEFGQPMVQLVPISDADVEIKTHLVSPEEWNHLSLMNIHKFSFLNFHRNKKKIIDSQEKKKCPFGFSK
jgi:hypothetical protein